MHRIIKLLPFGFVLFCASGASADYYEDYGKIGGGDFWGGTPPDGKDVSVTTEMEVSYETSTPTDQDDGTWACHLRKIKVSTKFNKSKSSIRDWTSASQIRYGQYYFDLTEYWARIEEQDLHAVVGKGKTPAEAEANAMAAARQALKADDALCMQWFAMYDKDTNNGRDALQMARWCSIIGSLLNPGKPTGTTTEDPNHDYYYDSMDRKIKQFAPAALGGFHQNGMPFNDNFLMGAQLIMPDMEFKGYHMGNVNPLFMPDVNNSTIMIVGPSGVALTGNLRVLVATGTSLRGWVEAMDIDPIAEQQSPFLQLLDQGISSGQMILTFEITFPIPLSQATNNFTQPAQLPARVVLGTKWQPLHSALAFSK